MKILNLYAGIGGNRKLWTDVEVTAVELNPDIADAYMELFPNDLIVINDAHLYLKSFFNHYDFIWSSPPCQKHSRMMKATRHDVVDYIDISLYQEIIFLQHFYKGLWVVENVIPYYKPLIEPIIQIGRHLFWSNFKINPFKEPKFPNMINSTTVESAELMKDFFDLKFTGKIYTEGNHHPTQVLRNCVHPELGLHILNCALQKEKVIQKTIFD
jgi:DNA (cytosine-5)-methyltransferase 1